MASGKKRVTLERFGKDRDGVKKVFRVTRATNTLDPEVGDLINEDQVADLTSRGIDYDIVERRSI